MYFNIDKKQNQSANMTNFAWFFCTPYYRFDKCRVLPVKDGLLDSENPGKTTKKSWKKTVLNGEFSRVFYPVLQAGFSSSHC